MKRMIGFICLVLFAWMAYQFMVPTKKSIDPQYIRLQAQVGSKYGYMDETGKIVIPPRYEYAFSFVENLGRVGEKRGDVIKWGLIDHLGNQVVAITYDWLGELSDGRVAFTTKESGRAKVGYFDAAGKVVIPPIFDFGEKFNEGVALVGQGSTARNAKWGLIGKDGKFLVAPIWSSEAVSYNLHDSMAEVWFSNGLMPLRDEATKLSGYIDTKGNWVLKPQFAQARPFVEGFAVVGMHVVENSKEVLKYGYIRADGSMQIPPRFDAADPFSEELALVAVGPDFISRRYGFIDRTGAYKIPSSYNPYQVIRNIHSGSASGTRFKEGLCAVAISATGLKQRGSWKYIDKQGNVVLLEGTGEVVTTAWDFEKGFAYIEVLDAFGKRTIPRYIDRKGNSIISHP